MMPMVMKDVMMMITSAMLKVRYIRMVVMMMMKVVQMMMTMVSIKCANNLITFTLSLKVELSLVWFPTTALNSQLPPPIFAFNENQVELIRKANWYELTIKRLTFWDPADLTDFLTICLTDGLDP